MTFPTRAAASIAALSLALLSCSDTSTSGKQTGTAGMEGATVVLAGTAAVQVGRGALSETITVTVATATPPVAVPAPTVSPVVEFTPHGTQFAIPAKISLTYTSQSPAARLKVLRLADPASNTWTPVGGAHIGAGIATFETTSFSYYVVTDGFECTPTSVGTDCTAECECCGTAKCVTTSTSALHCGACGQACEGTAFCAASACVPIASSNLCENALVYVVSGELGDLSVEDPAHTPDAASASAHAAALSAECGGTPEFVPQAKPGILDPCTDAPLLGEGRTIVLTGGNATQRLARYLDAHDLSPLRFDWDDAGNKLSFRSRGGTALGTWPLSSLTPHHDFFVVALVPDPATGALVLHVYGLGEEGTPAATWYFINKLLPEITAGTRSWQRYLFAEWTDDGDGIKNAADTYHVISQDVP